MDAEQPPRGTVLVVEDDADLRDTLAEVLRDHGYEVLDAANGDAALDCLRRGPTPCLILLDLMMPVMNGWEFREQQRQDPALAPIPVVVVSGAGDVHREAVLVDAAGYIAKPVDLDALLDIVTRHCG